MEVASHAFPNACPFRRPENPYEQTEAIWSNGVGQKADSVAGPSSSPCVQPIPLVLLQQWKYYFAFCGGIVAQEVDWRDVLAYMRDTSATAKCSLLTDFSGSGVTAMAECGADHNNCGAENRLTTTAGAYHHSAVFLMNTLADDCERRFGSCALRCHHQWLLRWTKMLAQCITWRLSHLFSKGEFVPPQELQYYCLVFAARAREVVGAEAYVQTLLELLEAGKNEELQCSRSTEETTSFSLTQTTTQNLTLTMTPSPLHVTPLCRGWCFPALSARVLDSLWADVLRIPWNVLNPNCMPEQVRRRVVAALNETHVDIDDPLPFSGNGRCRIHSATLREILGNDNLVKGGVENLLLGAVTRDPVCLQLVKPHQLLGAVYLLETVGYVMLTKLRCSMVDKCYYALPFLADFVSLGALLKNALPSSSGPSTASASFQAGTSKEVLGMGMGLIPMLIQALLEATEELYVKAVDRILRVYSNNTVKRLVKFCGHSEATLVSREAVNVLERVVEPTMEVLLLLLGQDCSSKGDWHFIDFIVNMLKAVLNEKMEAISKRWKTASVLLQCSSDRALLLKYIDDHSLLRRRASAM
ncbi:hypothetical protein TraAM80_03063 [Trypanosoma rangeli]|uniref:Uncharacterized protein n=1 Tax=Trypanosoma rangeli TaxID=5698 RepID=A0A3R7NUJ1_TRYRA|nr:uncharacterized protein TraAM80_03063 [Trypanosoma rangeli]RNF07915.1 hypothetical protein TraAM80_03063 [Trypanosoma rangeli]|eukprot:RNF07915.1 hypothetical protein TraAM80_03063 [Trypanosoma rangeli]